MNKEEKICINKKYEYKFIFNNEVYIADKCSTSRYGNSKCEKDSIIYENVPYKTTVVGCNKYLEDESKGFNSNISYIFLLVCILIGIGLTFKILYLFMTEE